MRGVALAMTLALAALAGCAEPIDPALEDAAADALEQADAAVQEAMPPSPKGHVAGIVLGHEAAPLPNATLRLGLREVVSGADGSFSFVDVPVGLHVLNATAPGHVPAEVPVEVVAGAIARPAVGLALQTVPPRYEVLRFDGASWFSGLDCHCSFSFLVGPGLAEVVLEATVDDSFFTSNQGLRYGLSLYGAENGTYASGHGGNPLHAVLPVDPTVQATEGHLRLQPDESVLFFEPYHRGFQAYLTLVYDAPAEAGYTALPQE